MKSIKLFGEYIIIPCVSMFQEYSYKRVSDFSGYFILCAGYFVLHQIITKDSFRVDLHKVKKKYMPVACLVQKNLISLETPLKKT